MRKEIRISEKSKCKTFIFFIFFYLAEHKLIFAQGTDGLTSSEIISQINALEKLNMMESPREELAYDRGENNFHIVNECVQISMDDGKFHYKSKGGSETCGLYFLADPDKLVVITIDYLNADCQHQALISIVDGWELNGELFPSGVDHEKIPNERFSEICGKKPVRRTFVSSQNAAMVQYRIPTYGQGFSLRVSHILNHKPCNVLVQDTEGVYKIENFGQRVNCSLTTLFDSRIQFVYYSVGVERNLKRPKIRSPTTLYKNMIRRRLRNGNSNRDEETIPQTDPNTECAKRGLGDYVELGGGNGIDSSRMTVIDEFCGKNLNPANKEATIFCGMTTVRLVSSGEFHNKIVAEVQRADLEHLDSATFICEP